MSWMIVSVVGRREAAWYGLTHHLFCFKYKGHGGMAVTKMSLQTDSFLGNYGFNFDFDTCINVRSNKEGNDVDESVMAHKLVLSSASTQFRNLLANRQSEESVAKIDIDLREIPNSINAFKAMLNGLYTGELNYTLADHAEILAVARHCQVPTIESKLLAVSQDSNSLTALLSQPEFSIIALSPPCEKHFL
uniref:BTB domain-containing protein n=1 Tax=Angiostrongylus cantonensis TaxID=6313 RepID=A0A0K0DQH4_ANGCA